ncbi:MAG: DUF115 domain-containing protein [Methanolinea sp.]|jgi:hypothetical protein|nr:DUF115 domain-containing protein [Methanolinea sp.]
MNFEEWEPIYEEIVRYFGFDREEDERAAEILKVLLPRDDLVLLEEACRGRDVCVCGNAPCLAREIPLVRGTVFAADAASLVLHSHGIRPDAIFTDLDGATDEYVDMNREGTIVVVHAHGDNIPLLRHWVPKLPGPLVGTTQSCPLPGVHNFGGFTDGDRAAFAAHSLGAASITILGFDLDDPHVDHIKRGKLYWAGRLLALLEP